MKKVLIPVFLTMVLVLVPFINVYAVTFPTQYSNFLSYEMLDKATGEKLGDRRIYSNGAISFSFINNEYRVFNGTTGSFAYEMYSKPLNGEWALLTSGPLNSGQSAQATTSIKLQISGSNYSVPDENGNIIYEPVVLPPSAIEMNILRPTENYIDTVDGFETLVSFKMPPNTLSQMVSINIQSEGLTQEDFKLQRWEYNQATGVGLASYFTSPISVGEHIINVTCNGITKQTKYTRLGGVVDEDSDGLDDRTGLPVGDGHAEEPIPDGTFITNTINNLKSLFTEFSGFQTFIKSFLSVFPTWITIPIASLFGVMIVMAILKVIRG